MAVQVVGAGLYRTGTKSLKEALERLLGRPSYHMAEVWPGNALQEVRYLADQQHDCNVTRQDLHPLWIAAQSVAGTNLIGLRSGLTRNQIIEIEGTPDASRMAKLLGRQFFRVRWLGQ